MYFMYNNRIHACPCRGETMCCGPAARLQPRDQGSIFSLLNLSTLHQERFSAIRVLRSEIQRRWSWQQRCQRRLHGCLLDTTQMVRVRVPPRIPQINPALILVVSRLHKCLLICAANTLGLQDRDPSNRESRLSWHHRGYGQLCSSYTPYKQQQPLV